MSKKDEKTLEGEEIVVKDPLDLRPKELPLVVTLPASASKAQVEFAKTLNSFAYAHPDKWAVEKDDRVHTDELGRTATIKGLLTQLKELKNAPDPVEQPAGVTIKNKLIDNN